MMESDKNDAPQDFQESTRSEETENAPDAKEIQINDKEELNKLKSTDLSELLMDGTKEVHEQSLNTQFVKDFLKGRIKEEVFKLATVALYYTYCTLEEEIERNKDHPAFAPMYFPIELHRKEALEKDLAFLYGSGWSSKIQCSAATKDHVERIRHVGQHEPELLVAHAYTRYMGDLSGGHVLKKAAQRGLHLPHTGVGTQFYVFENVTNARRFKQLYRARMDALDLDSITKDRIVEEAIQAFHFNMKLFEELTKIGAVLKEETQDKEILLQDIKGDFPMCPYYAVKGGSNSSTGYLLHAGLSVLNLRSVQLMLAAIGATVAVLAARFLM